MRCLQATTTVCPVGRVPAPRGELEGLLFVKKKQEISIPTPKSVQSGQIASPSVVQVFVPGQEQTLTRAISRRPWPFFQVLQTSSKHLGVKLQYKSQFSWETQSLAARIFSESGSHQDMWWNNKNWATAWQESFN
ncbi:hypothetical protein Bbelb_122850 [Branchiostoma belcheri]|nr:hypothetical protein Bbelb_122850 [Branchiostoma belcheri]